MTLDLTGRVAVVTGGSRGIGFGIAHALASAGAHVAIGARNRHHLERAVTELERAHPHARALGHACDVRSQNECETLIRRTVSELGGIDILVNNAGIGKFANVEHMNPDDWRAVIATNLDGVFYCTHAALPHLKARGSSWIINIGSLAGKNAFAGGAAYNASKHGLIGFSEALMQEVRYDGVRVSYIMPGSVATDFSSRGSNADWKIQPEDIGQLVLDLVSMPERTLPSRIEVRPSQPPR